MIFWWIPTSGYMFFAPSSNILHLLQKSAIGLILNDKYFLLLKYNKVLCLGQLNYNTIHLVKMVLNCILTNVKNVTLKNFVLTNTEDTN